MIYNTLCTSSPLPQLVSWPCRGTEKHQAFFLQDFEVKGTPDVPDDAVQIID